MSGGKGNYNFKIVLLGEGCVGKTSCVVRYVEDNFVTTYKYYKQCISSGCFLFIVAMQGTL